LAQALRQVISRPHTVQGLLGRLCLLPLKEVFMGLFWFFIIMPKSIETPLTLSPGDVSAVIQMAWEDRTTFETIFERTGVTEPGVIKIMRAELSSRSFKMWRARMRGRVTKHRELRSPDMRFDDRAIADHRRANC
jgi:uncharacterized protein (TIGR03643 family)